MEGRIDREMDEDEGMFRARVEALELLKSVTVISGRKEWPGVSMMQTCGWSVFIHGWAWYGR